MSETVPVTVAVFRTCFHGAFASTTNYPDEDVQRYLDMGTKRCDQNRWVDMTALGIELFTAHMLTLDYRDSLTAGTNAPGALRGTATSKSVGGASIGYDISSITEMDGGFWNSTSYGTRFLRFVRMVGATPLQIV